MTDYLPSVWKMPSTWITLFWNKVIALGFESKMLTRSDKPTITDNH